MPKAIKITAGQVQVDAELNDNPTAKAVVQELPIKGAANRWGGEIYFAIPVTAELEEFSRRASWDTGLPVRHFASSLGQLPHRKAMKLERPQT